VARSATLYIGTPLQETLATGLVLLPVSQNMQLGKVMSVWL